MALGTCDPAAYGRSYNTLNILVANDVQIEIRWNWDGTSVYPDCDGPLVNGGGGADRWAVRATNNGTVTYYAHTTRRNGQPATYQIDPGQVRTVTAAQASNSGYSTISDFNDLTLTTTP